MTKSNANKTVQSAKISIQITRILGGWITAHCSYLDGGRSLAFGTIFKNLKSIANTAIQRNICSYIITQHWKGRLEKTKLQKYSHIGPACAKGWENEKERKFAKTTQNLRRTD